MSRLEGILWRLYLTALVFVTLALAWTSCSELYSKFKIKRESQILADYLSQQIGDWKRLPIPYPFDPYEFMNVKKKPPFDPTKPFEVVTGKSTQQSDPDIILKDSKDRQNECFAGILTYSNVLGACLNDDHLPQELFRAGLLPSTFVGDYSVDYAAIEMWSVLLGLLLMSRYWGTWLFKGKFPLKFP